ncbi:MAG: precorrin-6A/cobalt-precorrin-6A reductase [Lachnospiraceae bacterium]|nr:precorrin-6A/cobalt-precorrin-6A reductase [Lachnospiraceae bacterium]
MPETNGTEKEEKSRPDSREDKEGAFALPDERKTGGEILVAAGTTEGRRLCEFFAARGQTVYAFVATEYGEEMLPDSPYLIAETGRKNADEMFAFIRAHEIRTCYDAMHPYATLAHQNIKEACGRSGCAYTRILRERDGEKAESVHAELSERVEIDNDTDSSESVGTEKANTILPNTEHCDVERTASCVKKSCKIVRVASIREASEFLKNQAGNILVTTGSRELRPFTEIWHYEERIWVRVLPSVESLEACHEAGFIGKQVIAMHGPFSKEMNELLLREHHIRWLVTKDSGKAGGVAEKLEAAWAAGAGVILVERPREDAGIPLKQLMKCLERETQSNP